MNKLFYGDNLDILRNEIADESVDLIYLDPPFNSNATYNVIFRSPTGEKSQAQVQAFKDSWNWQIDGAERAYDDILKSPYSDAAELVVALRKVLGESDLMAYLTMMAVRLIELHRVLKPTGSIYLHCDQTASHYLKILLDSIFEQRCFMNEIIWKRRVGMSSAVHGSNRFGTITDTILMYGKSDDNVFSPQYNLTDPDYKKYIAERFTYTDENGKKFQPTSLVNPAYRPNLIYDYKGYKSPPNGWMITKEKMEQWDKEGKLYFPRDKDGRIRRKSFADELRGMPIQNLWTDIPEINSQAQERLGYPTQKPIALLERIISASSNEGDLVLDPFCGCGTTIHASQKLGREWIGIDITHLAIALIERRLKKAFPGIQFAVSGVPIDIDGAQALSDADKFQFQSWALSLVEAQPFKGGVKGADGGVDGIAWFHAAKNVTEKAIVSVKGGKNVSDTQVKDLITTVEHTGAKMGLFITLAPPTKPMVTRAATAGFYKTEFGEFPKIQILTIEELLQGKQPLMPPRNEAAFKKPKTEQTGKQGALDL